MLFHSPDPIVTSNVVPDSANTLPAPADLPPLDPPSSLSNWWVLYTPYCFSSLLFVNNSISCSWMERRFLVCFGHSHYTCICILGTSCVVITNKLFDQHE